MTENLGGLGGVPNGVRILPPLESTQLTENLQSPESTKSARHGTSVQSGTRLREWGSGSVYLRGRRWWISYPNGGSQIKESSKSANRADAEKLLSLRLRGVPKQHSHKDIIDREVARLATIETVSRGNIGAISEYLVSIILINAGFEVFRAMTPNASCDLIAKRGDHLLRVEVKTNLVTNIRPEQKFDVLVRVVRGEQVIFEPPLESLLEKTAPEVAHA